MRLDHLGPNFVWNRIQIINFFDPISAARFTRRNNAIQVPTILNSNLIKNISNLFENGQKRLDFRLNSTFFIEFDHFILNSTIFDWIIDIEMIFLDLLIKKWLKMDEFNRKQMEIGQIYIEIDRIYIKIDQIYIKIAIVDTVKTPIGSKSTIQFGWLGIQIVD